MKTLFAKVDNQCPESEAIRQAAAILRCGGLVAFPTETVYGLGADGTNPRAAARIYEAKGRPSDNPLILHIADREALRPLVAEIPPMALPLMEAFWPGPLTLIFRKSGLIPYETTGGLDTVAVRMPSHPVAQALIREAGLPVAAPSANRSGRPSPTRASHVLEDLDGAVDMILDGGEVKIGLESTILDVTGDEPVLLRPGYISLSAVQRLMGAGTVDPALLAGPDESLRPRAPGMKYRHYAPRARMTILEGEAGRVAAAIRERAARAQAQGLRVGVLCAEESREQYPGLFCLTVGTRAHEETIAHNLFRCLRDFDEAEVDEIYSEAFRGGELEGAIMNRLLKAAGHRVVNVDEEGMTACTKE